MTAPPSLWQLARVEVQAFRGADQSRSPARLAFGAATLVALAAYDRRAHSSGQAVCLLAPRWVRLAVYVTGVVSVAGVIAALVPLLGWALLVLTALAFLPLAVRGARALPAKGRLSRSGPGRRHRRVYVHSVASTCPGAGAELMTSLVREADLKGWFLVLDASNERLGTYYSRFGFARGGTAKMPDGAVRVRMWREPQSPLGRQS